MKISIDRKSGLLYVTYFYALATIQIVLVHARMMRVENPKWIVAMVDFVSAYHMVLFFFIAGVLLSYTEGRHQSLWKWYKGKLVKLISPFIILTGVAYLPKVLLEPILNNGANFSFAYLLQILFYPRKTIWGHFWFIPVYLVVMPVCFFLVKAIRKNKFVWTCVILVTAVLNYFPIDIGWFGISDICRFSFYTVLGITVEPFINRDTVKKVIGSWRFLSVLVAAAGVTGCFNAINIVLKVHILIMVVLFLSVSMLLEHYELKWLEKIGNCNLTIYIYSWPIQAVLEILLVSFLSFDLNATFVIKAIAGLVGPLVLIRIANMLPFVSRLKTYLGI